MSNKRSLRVVGLFAGVGGIEKGLHEAGHRAELLCEIEPSAQAVLRAQFEGVPIAGDVRQVGELPDCDLVCAGFPCQDLSQAGRTAGIAGANSGLVSEVFRLLDRSDPEWVCFENVPFMLRLDRGRAMTYLTDQLGSRGYTWAYRVVDSRSFGLPQRRKRVVVLASRVSDPRPVLFAEEGECGTRQDEDAVGCGFYWTEGTRGLGWAVDAIPTLKGGSTIGIPSPPAIRLPHSQGIVTPDIQDAERLQGFPPDWTLPSMDVSPRRGSRWKLVGNAVSVPIATWLGHRLATSASGADSFRIGSREKVPSSSWPDAAWGRPGEVHVVERSHWPLGYTAPPLLAFLKHDLVPLSERATAGFLRRASNSSLRFPDGFLADVAAHHERVQVDRQLELVSRG